MVVFEGPWLALYSPPLFILARPFFKPFFFGFFLSLFFLREYKERATAVPDDFVDGREA